MTKRQPLATDEPINLTRRLHTSIEWTQDNLGELIECLHAYKQLSRHNASFHQTIGEKYRKASNDSFDSVVRSVGEIKRAYWELLRR
jgi:hypothetical protein